jgi:hypothetical protein
LIRLSRFRLPEKRQQGANISRIITLNKKRINNLPANDFREAVFLRTEGAKLDRGFPRMAMVIGGGGGAETGLASIAG